jgi:peptidoglycan/LPS O-acetylase OafA/YrhL
MKECKSLPIEQNALDYLRYFAAFSVMLLHYTGYFLILSKNGSNVIQGIRNISLLFPGVVILFSISGFLIPASYERSRTRKIFYKKRVLRLYPELWACTLVNFAVLFLFAKEKFDRSMAVWFLTQAVGFAYTPSCLKDFATGSTNGALWTIFVEIQFYLLVPLCWPMLKKAGRSVWIIFIAAAFVCNVLSRGLADRFPDTIVSKLLERTLIPYVLWFLIGMYLYRFRDSALPVLKKVTLPLLIVYLLIEKAPFFSTICSREQAVGYYTGVITGTLLPFLTIGVGYLLPAARVKKDLSYELFLYHWIVLNIIVYFNLMNRIPWPCSLLLFLCVSLAAAFTSYSARKKWTAAHVGN